MPNELRAQPGRIGRHASRAISRTTAVTYYRRVRFASAINLAILAAATSLGAQSPITAFEREKARALFRTQLPCLGCHELDGEGGSTAPSLTNVGTRRSAAYIADIITNPSRRLPGVAMPDQPMPAWTRELVVRYLAQGATGPDVPSLPAASPAAPAIADGSVLYGKWCAGCHGTGGNGDGPNARRLPIPPARHADANAMALRPDDSLYDVIAAGGLAWGRSPRMPAFGATLSDAEIRALVARIRVLCRCQAPAWSRGLPPPVASPPGRARSRQ